MTEIINITILFLSTVIFYAAISGYGVLFLKNILKLKIENIFHSFFWGIIFIFILQYFLYFFFQINYYTNYIITLLGLILFTKNIKIFKKDLFLFGKILCALATILIIGKTHEDFKHHHLQMINVLFESKLTFGLSNLNPQFIYMPSLAYVISLTKILNYENNLFHIIPFLIFINFICYLYLEIINQNNKKISPIFLIVLIASLIQFKFLKNHGFDTPAFIYAFFAFTEIIKNKKNIYECLSIFLFSLSIKITAIFGAPIILYYAYKKLKFIILKSRLLFFLFFLFNIIILSNFINNGCIIYFLEKTCFDQQKVIWAVNKSDIKEISIQTELDTKAYFTQKKITADNYLKKFNWVNDWFRNNFLYKISNFIFTYIALFFIIKFFFKLKFKFLPKKYEILIAGFCLIAWFIKIPTLRYGYFVNTVFIFLFFSSLLSGFDYRFKKKVNIILIFFIIIINILNYKRIDSEFKRKDTNFFKSFPFYYIPERKFTKLKLNEFYFYKKNDNLLYPCWNIPSPCLERNDITIYKKNNYNFILRGLINNNKN
jgi:hypothetical protein